MALSKQHLPTARFALISVFVIALLLQFWVVPLAAAQAANQYPEYADLARPYVIAIGIAIGLFELALVAAWQILSAAADARPTRWWATIFTLALISSGVVFAGVFIHAGSVARVGGPPMLFGLLVALAVVVGAVALRHKASELTLVDAEV